MSFWSTLAIIIDSVIETTTAAWSKLHSGPAEFHENFGKVGNDTHDYLHRWIRDCPQCKKPVVKDPASELVKCRKCGTWFKGDWETI
ncbi:hypothetical protein BDZ45DRAFT_737020 [Acephala macrosclerotiorum]|nr:hypothetical protein BDZ45DRAFT_737020 [Acephala macrosclerotiorum]